MKKLLVVLFLLQYGCAVQQSAPPVKNIITVYNDYDLYSYEYIADVSCDIAANDKTVQENIKSCIAVLHDEARAKNADAIHTYREEDCIKDEAINCAKSNAVKMTARAHRSD